jgi:diguanylate cyclase (GGDEF)-like protein/PAS domain S-box-containing protein
MSRLRIGVVGDEQAHRSVVLAMQGQDAEVSLQSDGSDLDAEAVIVLCIGESMQSRIAVEVAERHGRVVVAARRIDMGVVTFATFVGASDAVLIDDRERLREAILRAAERRPDGDVADVPSDVALLRRVVDLTPNLVSVRDASGHVILVSQSFADFYGSTVEAMTGRSLSEVMPTPAEAERERAEDADVLAHHRSRMIEREVVDSSGTLRRLQIVKRLLQLDDGRAYVLAVAVDVTGHARSEQALVAANRFRSNVLEAISEAVFALDDSGRFTFVNHRLSELTGYTSAELVGSSLFRLISPPSLLDVRRYLHEALERPDEEHRFDLRIRRADGVERDVLCTFLGMASDGGETGVVGTWEDVTQRREAERRVEHLTMHDPLTDLPNRRLLQDRIAVALSQARRDGRKVALLYMDLNRFKSVNDALGHAAGDMLLRTLAVRLRAAIREGDTIARLGGDEFVFLAPAVESIADAAAMAEHLLSAVRLPFLIGDTEYVITGSVGIAIYPDHADDPESLLRSADLALFEAKRSGNEGWTVYAEHMVERSFEHFVLENDLRRALDSGELAVHYQPVIDLAGDTIAAVEALVRWKHPTRGLLLPEMFIPLAEETGLIVPLGQWILHEACLQAVRWREEGVIDVPIAVNLSARQFDRGLVASLRSIIERTGIEPSSVTLELTESAVVKSTAAGISVVEELKDAGVRIAIDDFGTGYSSLSYLEQFPLDALKIDRSFLPRDHDRISGGAIATAIIALAHGLGLEVVAEGVETAFQRDFLLARSCTLAQGFLFALPMPAAEFEEYVRVYARRRIPS